MALLKLRSHGILQHYLRLVDQSRSFSQFILQYLIFSINSFWQYLSFLNIFSIDLAWWKCVGLPPHYLYRNILTLTAFSCIICSLKLIIVYKKLHSECQSLKFLKIWWKFSSILKIIFYSFFDPLQIFTL